MMMDMWAGRKKAITFSFDDGVTQDLRLVEIFNRYGLKCTFNLNSGLLGLTEQIKYGDGVVVSHNKIYANQVKRLAEGHEIAVHTYSHPSLKILDDETIIREVEKDREILSDLCGHEVIGMAYPGGSSEYIDRRVAEVVEKHTSIRYARTVMATGNFKVQKDDLYMWHPTIHFIDKDFEKIVDEFIEMEITDTPQLLFVWGHSYELDSPYMSWEEMERLCKKLSGNKNIFYGTNREILEI